MKKDRIQESIKVVCVFEVCTDIGNISLRKQFGFSLSVNDNTTGVQFEIKKLDIHLGIQEMQS
jgi:hypothetical protein